MIAYEPGTDHVEAFIATGTAIALALGAAATGTAGAISAHAQGNAARDAANTTATSANHAADLQSNAAANALAFQKQQAEADFQNSELTRRANYDQFVASRHRLDTLGGLLGQGPQVVPDYVPGKDPNFTDPASAPPGSVNGTTAPTTTGSPAPGSSNAPTGSFGNLNDANAWLALVGNPAQLTKWVQQGLGPTATPDLVNYYVGKIQGQPGANPTEQAGGANYWLQKFQQATTGPTTGPAGTTAPPGSINATGYAPMTYGPITPAIQPPRVSYQPGSIGATTRGY